MRGWEEKGGVFLEAIKNVSLRVCGVCVCRKEREVVRSARKFEKLKETEYNLQRELVLQRGLTQNAKQVQTMTP